MSAMWMEHFWYMLHGKTVMRVRGRSGAKYRKCSDLAEQDALRKSGKGSRLHWHIGASISIFF